MNDLILNSVFGKSTDVGIDDQKEIRIYSDFQQEIFMFQKGISGTQNSQVLVEYTENYLKNSFLNYLSDQDITLNTFYDLRYPVAVNLLLGRLMDLNQSIWQLNSQNRSGDYTYLSHLTIVYREYSSLYVINIGSNKVFVSGSNGPDVNEASQYINTNGNIDIYGSQYVANSFGLFPRLYFEVRQVDLQNHESLLICSESLGENVQSGRINLGPNSKVRSIVENLLYTESEHKGYDAFEQGALAIRYSR